MADENQKMHPTLVSSAPSTDPLVSHRLSTTDGKDDPIPSNSHPRPQSNHIGVVSDRQHAAAHSLEQRNQHPTVVQPPSLTHNSLPVHHPLKPPKNTGFCCRCICYTFTLLLIFIIIIAILALTFYLIFKPKIPKYSVDKLSITDLKLNTDLSLYARFHVKIKAINPNKKIGIYYEKGGHISVWYPKTNTEICKGSIPVFYQGHHNTTVLDVVLTGQNQYGSALLSALQVQQQTGNVPLDLKVDAFVAVELGSLKMPKVRFFVLCSLVVDNLTTSSNVVGIRTSDCRVNFKL